MTSRAENADKGQLRRALRSRRAALPAEAHAAAEHAAAEALAQHPAQRVAAYVSVGSEPRTPALLAALADREVLLPVLLPDGDLDWARADDGLQPGRHGLLEPSGSRLGPDAVATCGLLVVPALGVDRTGTRLGRGGGSYDRALARAAGWVVALLHDGELLPALPREPHDRPVHAVVTPAHGLTRLIPHPADGAPAGLAKMEP
jgi:5-formyltetrahydrofolate cyclo-ligase